MRIATLAVTALLAVPLAACSSGGSTTAAGTTSAPAPSSTTAASPSESSSSTAAAGPGVCGGLTKDDLAKYLVYTQIVAQVRDASSLDGIRNGTVGGYTPEKLDAILAKMSFLTGDGAAAVTYFQSLDASIARLLVDKPTTADFTAYQAQSGGIPGVLQEQLQLNQAVGTTCPNLR